MVSEVRGPKSELRLETSLLAIEYVREGFANLAVLAAGTDLIVLPDASRRTGMVRVSANGRDFDVFATDLQDRSTDARFDS